MDPPPLMYAELADWWPLVSRPEDYREEAAVFRGVLEGSGVDPLRSLLELGSGGGSNASHLKARFDMTLVDLSEGMLKVSRALNPDCLHELGDMRSVRLGRSFDAVFVHDAIQYMTSEADLRAAFETAFVHCRPGGVALFVPDETKERFEEGTDHGGHDGDGPPGNRRAVRYLEWSHDPDPTDDSYLVDYVFALREGDGPPKVATDRHRLGLFPLATWLRLLGETGFERVAAVPFRLSDVPQELELFIAHRPEGRGP